MAGQGPGLYPNHPSGHRHSCPEILLWPCCTRLEKSASGRNPRLISGFGLRGMRAATSSLLPAPRREDQAMNVFESILANERFVLPKQSWIIPGLTLGASLVAVVLALA